MKKTLENRIFAFMCAIMLTITSVVTYPVSVNAKVLPGLSELGRQVADEGCVLVENRNNVLPFQNGTTVSIFGRAQCHYDKYKTGLGSGGDVKVDGKDLVNYIDGIRRNDKLNVNEDLVKIYQDWVNGNQYDNGNNGWEGHPWSQKEMPMTQDIANAAKNNSDAAVIVIARTAGESRDSAFKKGGYLLTDEEENMIKIVSETFDKTVVLLNVTAIIDMSWVDKYNVDSVIYTWNGGQNGGDAVADVLSGDVNPSGRLADTIATDYTKYPTYENYGGKEKSYYEEDIYVGYRYFETFAPNDVKYPFGYGLSYTTFDIATNGVTEEDDYLKVSVSVTNTGNVAGKEVVQVYYGAPQAALGNPAKELAAFAKTELLEPGETQNIALSFKISDMASYDDSGVTGHESCYVLEAGDYKIYVGNNVRESSLVDTYKVPTLKVTETLSEAAAPYKDENFNRFKAVENGNEIKLEQEKVPTLHTNIEQRIKDNLPKEYQSKNDGNRYKLIDVYNKKLTMEEFVGQMTNEEMAAMVIGNSQNEAANGLTNGCAGGFGGSICMTNGQRSNLGKEYGIPLVGVADGPSGLRLQDYNTLLPCGNVIGCTWNPKLIEEMFELEGKELVLNEVDSLLGPGINIHRDPRCGRNFEYYSEDPLLTGMMAAATAQGVQKAGATVTAKHYACNNQESDLDSKESRRNTDAIVSERALREIYLKGFEIYVKSGQARSLMTSYNPVNGCWASTNYDLNTTILRGEWGYTGIVMTDWWGDLSNLPYADGTRNKNSSNGATMVKAQNDVFMKEEYTYKDNGDINAKIRNITDKINEGYLTRGELQRTAINICNFAMTSQRFALYNNIEFKPYFVEGEDWFKVKQAELGNPVVTGISVDGRNVSTFNQKVLEYKVYLPEGAEIPEVTATSDEATEITIEQATQDNPIAVIRAKEQQAIKTYKITFTDQDNLTPVFDDAELAEIDNIFVNGKAINGFDSNIFEYEVAVQSLNETPVITCEKEDNVTVTSEYDSTGKMVTVKAVSKDQARSYKLKLGIAPQSDEFDDTNLQNFWSIINEKKDNWKLQDGHLTIGAEYGSIWQNQDHLKNQFVQSAYGDWIAEVKIDLPKLPSMSYQSLGVIAMEDQDNYVYVKMESGNEGRVISLCQEKNGQINTIENLPKTDVERFTNVMYVRLKKLGNTYIASVSSDGNDYYRFATSVQADYDNPRFALVNGNGDQELPEVLEAQFDYVHFNQNVGEVVTVGDKKAIKVAEVDPVAISSSLKPAECQDTDKGYHLTDSKENEYVTYRINVEKTGIYDFNARMASPVITNQQVTFSASIDNRIVASFFGHGTGGEQSWIDLNGGKARLSAGEHYLKITFNTTGINLNRIELELVTELQDSELQKAIDEGKEKDLSIYTDDSRQRYEEALISAKEVLKNADSQDKIDDALKTLQEAESKLVSNGKIMSITPEMNLISLGVTESIKINVSVEPTEYTEKLQWKSEDEKIAKVSDDGTVTGVSAGTTVISVSNGGDIKAEVTVKVNATQNVNTYKVTFDSVGGSVVPSQIINEGEKAQKPKNPTRKGYTFKGWFVGGKEYDFASEVTGDIVLTAQWEKDEQSNTNTDPTKPGNSDSDKNNENNGNNGNNGTGTNDGNSDSDKNNENNGNNGTGTNDGNSDSDKNNENNGNNGTGTNDGDSDSNKNNGTGSGTNPGGSNPDTNNGNVTNPDTNNGNENGNGNGANQGVTNPDTNTGNGATSDITPDDNLKVGVRFEKGKLTYKITKSVNKEVEVQVIKPVKNTYSSISIPKTVTFNGTQCKVTSIGNKAFKNNKKLKTVTIDKNVVIIGEKAFYNCKKLSKVTFKKNSLTGVGKGAFLKTAKNLKIKTGSKSTIKKYKEQLKKKCPAGTVVTK